MVLNLPHNHSHHPNDMMDGTEVRVNVYIFKMQKHSEKMTPREETSRIKI